VPPASPPGPRKRKSAPAMQQAASYKEDRRVSGPAVSVTSRGAGSAPVASVAVAAPPAPSTSPSASVATASSSAGAAALDNEVQNSLDNLKDKLFRLELRRQAGTITEEEYVRERARTEAILRELVRG
jgi:hypothetical protein